jgi:hypothetical protein
MYLRDWFGNIRAEMSDEEPAERAAFNAYFRFLFLSIVSMNPRHEYRSHSRPDALTTKRREETQGIAGKLKT